MIPRSISIALRTRNHHLYKSRRQRSLKSKEDPDLGFVQIDSLDDDLSMDQDDDWLVISLVNISKGDNRAKMPFKSSKDPGDGMMLEYVPCQYNYIGSTEYFTPCMISGLDHHGFTKSKYINFHNKNHVEVFLAEF